MEEMWQDLEGYKGYYKISNYGRIKSIDRDVHSRYKNIEYKLKKYGKILKPHLNSKNTRNAYYRVCLSKESIIKWECVHRLIAKTFIPNPDNKPQVNHKDGNKLNNDIENLEWVTSSENSEHACKIGLKVMPCMKGESHHSNKLTEIEVIKIKKTLKYDKIEIGHWSRLAKELNVSPSCISDVVNGRHWTHVII
jgi:hypothetical protein